MIWGRWSILTNIFQKGLKPPTRLPEPESSIDLGAPGHHRGFERIGRTGAKHILLPAALLLRRAGGFRSSFDDKL